jgi:hypothetical protein
MQNVINSRDIVGDQISQMHDSPKRVKSNPHEILLEKQHDYQIRNAGGFF